MVCYKLAKFGSPRDCSSRYVFDWSRDQARLRDISLRGRLESLKVSHHPATFGGHRYHNSGDIMCYWRYNGFSLLCDLAGPRDQRFM